jgi:hypothetical protein
MSVIKMMDSLEDYLLKRKTKTMQRRSHKATTNRSGLEFEMDELDELVGIFDGARAEPKSCLLRACLAVWDSLSPTALFGKCASGEVMKALWCVKGG